eukprot:gene6033-6644_t
MILVIVAFVRSFTLIRLPAVVMLFGFMLGFISFCSWFYSREQLAKLLGFASIIVLGVGSVADVVFTIFLHPDSRCRSLVKQEKEREASPAQRHREIEL